MIDPDMSVYGVALPPLLIAVAHYYIARYNAPLPQKWLYDVALMVSETELSY